MKTLLLNIAICCSLVLQAQYYYSDITGTLEINRQMQTFLTNKVSMVTATGYTPEGSKATDFAEVVELLENGKTLKTSRNSELTHSSFYQRFDAQNRLISMMDTSSGIQNMTTYEYDTGGKIKTIQNTVKDHLTGINMVELHQWIYNKDGRVEKMWRTINGTDSLEIRFFPDENGNPGEERTFRNGIETDMLYYYFDEQNRITDIVRYNKKVKKLIPDEIISYDDADRVIQRITSTPGDNLRKTTWVGYIIWRYIYNVQGLKTKEALFDNEQQLTGKIEYKYTFGK
jgi:antitoxin component YwqK of YwqJK toxin-antitoxin module